MNINGWLKNSFVDYPGKIATTIFVSGCNFLCPYCHNADLVKKDKNLETYSIEDISKFLNKRKGMIDAICISGGEPTIYKDLISTLEDIKVQNKDILIKLDTNGTNPSMLKEIIEKNLVNYIAMDIKAPLQKYSKIANTKEINLNSINESIKLLKETHKKGTIQCEFRTTITRNLLTQTDLIEIGKLIKGEVPYYMQQYKYSKKQIENIKFESFSKEELEEIANILRKSIKKVEIRNV